MYGLENYYLFDQEEALANDLILAIKRVRHRCIYTPHTLGDLSTIYLDDFIFDVTLTKDDAYGFTIDISERCTGITVMHLVDNWDQHDESLEVVYMDEHVGLFLGYPEDGYKNMSWDFQ